MILPEEKIYSPETNTPQNTKVNGNVKLRIYGVLSAFGRRVLQEIEAEGYKYNSFGENFHRSSYLKNQTPGIIYKDSGSLYKDFRFSEGISILIDISGTVQKTVILINFIEDKEVASIEAAKIKKIIQKVIESC